MKIALIVIMSLLLVYVLLSYPFSFRLKVHADAINLVCFYSLKINFIKLLCGKSSITSSTLVTQNTHDLILAPMKSSPMQKAFVKQLLPKIKISKAEVYFTGGVESNACTTALLCGSVQILSSILTSALISSSPLINIYQDIDTDFTKDALEISASCVLQLSLNDIFLAFIASVFSKKESKN